MNLAALVLPAEMVKVAQVSGRPGLVRSNLLGEADDQPAPAPAKKPGEQGDASDPEVSRPTVKVKPKTPMSKIRSLGGSTGRQVAGAIGRGLAGAALTGGSPLGAIAGAALTPRVREKLAQAARTGAAVAGGAVRGLVGAPPKRYGQEPEPQGSGEHHAGPAAAHEPSAEPEPAGAQARAGARRRRRETSSAPRQISRDDPSSHRRVEGPGGHSFTVVHGSVPGGPLQAHPQHAGVFVDSTTGKHYAQAGHPIHQYGAYGLSQLAVGHGAPTAYAAPVSGLEQPTPDMPTGPGGGGGRRRRREPQADAPTPSETGSTAPWWKRMGQGAFAAIDALSRQRITPPPPAPSSAASAEVAPAAAQAPTTPTTPATPLPQTVRQPRPAPQETRLAQPGELEAAKAKAIGARQPAATQQQQVAPAVTRTLPRTPVPSFAMRSAAQPGATASTQPTPVAASQPEARVLPKAPSTKISVSSAPSFARRPLSGKGTPSPTAEQPKKEAEPTGGEVASSAEPAATAGRHHQLAKHNKLRLTHPDIHSSFEALKSLGVTRDDRSNLRRGARNDSANAVKAAKRDNPSISQDELDKIETDAYAAAVKSRVDAIRSAYAARQNPGQQTEPSSAAGQPETQAPVVPATTAAIAGATRGAVKAVRRPKATRQIPTEPGSIVASYNPSLEKLISEWLR